MAIMIGGTSSHAGKSVIVAALCRILSRIGYAVAPFKAQNMSLNSYVTKDGKEIAIAQAFQAKAAGVEPSELMNPILLKPKGEFVSQLIVLGEVLKDVSTLEYYKEIPWLVNKVKHAFEELEKEYEVIVIEGAGGMAEINLYDRDLANISIARIAKPDVYIVGDIDRGGVFSSLYGTYKLLPNDVASLVKGFIINRLRGSKSLLRKGIEEIERLTSIPVIGTIPYLSKAMPAEDSLSIEEWEAGEASIGILRLPRISNFTDFEPLRFAGIDFIPLNGDLSKYDIVFLPGTKDTIADLKALKELGMEEKLKKIAGKTPIIGICGGYQMLGKEIIDRGVEHGWIRVKGLGLLDAVTVFDEFKKKTLQVEKRVTGSAVIVERIRGEKVWGYEIHKGKTITMATRQVFEDDGCASDDGMVWGTYLHGLFTNKNVAKAVADFLDVCYSEPEDGIEALASIILKKVDVEVILRNAGLV
jgi:adenosylcobyric acid synthase